MMFLFIDVADPYCLYLKSTVLCPSYEISGEPMCLTGTPPPPPTLPSSDECHIAFDFDCGENHRFFRSSVGERRIQKQIYPYIDG
jgi:hypothetical protein